MNRVLCNMKLMGDKEILNEEKYKLETAEKLMVTTTKNA